ncbi:hypothetical protein C5167_024733 [Papaver somniferum]|uniref:DNA-directed RNA polymerase III subunit RPC5 n=1 Tax=Papaver somniferum TaxID=3469 RepID=A0A4Y7JR19_PAPSO|nr:hypothetical protein C5167_024733 [Papaver somniferum]
MDIDLDLSAKSSSTRPSTFTPKTPSKFKPKIPKSEPLIVPKSEVEDFNPDEQLKQVEIISKQELKLQPMEVDSNPKEDEEDEVVREIDVFFNPSPLDADTQLYVLQYPLRPSWRPYEMDQKCQKVRFKPKEVKVEIDLSLDLDENYDDNVDDHLRITKQTLVSKKVPLTKGCAVGVLVGNQALSLSVAKGDQVSRFVSLKYLAPDDPEEIVLQEIQQHANLVQGLWVCKTNLLPLKGAEMVARDKILCLFSKMDRIRDEILEKMLEELGCHSKEVKKAVAEAAMASIAVHRDKCRDWKFKVPKDMSFIKDHPEIVKEQEHLWQIRENTRKTENSMRNKLKPRMAKNLGIPDSGVKKKVRTKQVAF